MRMCEFFAGMGNFREGFERAGWEVVWSCEWDKNKRRIYKVIYGAEPEADDICGLHAGDIPDAECWTFGAPCQDFSIAGKRAGLDGNRSSLVGEIFRLLKEKDAKDRPEWLVYENVKGMLSSNSGWDFAEILAQMDECGYDAEWQLVDSQYFGVPQHRERVYTVGHLRTYGGCTGKIFPVGYGGETNQELQGQQAVSCTIATIYYKKNRGSFIEC